MSRYRAALAVPEFRAIFIAHVISMTGTVTANFALVFLIYSRTGSTLLSALVFALVLAPHLLAGTLLSSLIDRLPARRLLVTCNVVSAALVVVMSFGGTPVPAVLLLAFALGMIEPVFAGTRAAVLPDILPGETYVPGRSLLRLVIQGAQLGGYAVGGLLLAVLSPPSLLLVNAGCFLTSAIVLRLFTKERRPEVRSEQTTRRSLLVDSLVGVKAVMANRKVRRILVLGWAVPAIGVAPEAMAVPYADALGAAALGAGLMLSAMPIGTVLGEICTNWLISPQRQMRLVTPTAMILFTPLLFFAARPGLPLAILLLVLSGLGFSLQVGQDRKLLEVVSDDLRARTLSLQMAGLMFWQGLGFAVAGVVGQFLSPHHVVAAAGCCGLVVVALWAIRRPANAPVKVGGVR
nr:MFS transporter [uncultured Actinoplanes sp.]